VSALQPIVYADGVLRLLDQRALPTRTAHVTCRTAEDVAQAIHDMVVRGAPAIAIAAAYGLALAQRQRRDLDVATALLAASRPTAVNLRWALDRLRGASDVEAAARALHDDDVAVNRMIGANGSMLLEGGVVTICNTGALATGGHGTALGMIRSARAAGQRVHVYALETRPYLQGARLTAYECAVEGIPCTVLPDGALAALLASGRVRAAVAGCDRVAANGDTANKIGTRGLATLCAAHRVPFWVAMPLSSLDRDCPDGAAIPIEERPGSELFDAVGGAAVYAGSSVDAWNPAFDVTPASLISGWVTERTVERPPFA
jgi:methylthioribose-1-phosphate isomerase